MCALTFFFLFLSPCLLSLFLLLKMLPQMSVKVQVSLCVCTAAVHIPFCQIVHVWPWVRHFPGDAKQNWSLNTLHFYWFRVRRNALNWWICIGFETKGMWFPCLCYHLLLINISGWIKKVESGHLLQIFLKDVLKICILQFNEHFALSSIMALCNWQLKIAHTQHGKYDVGVRRFLSFYSN